MSVANKNKVVGQVKVRVDGDLLETDGSSTMELGGAKRSSVTGDYQASAFSESTEPAKCEVNLLMKAGLGLVALSRIDDATLTMETDVGRTYIMRGAYVAEVISFGSNDGKAKVVFMAGPAEEML